MANLSIQARDKFYTDLDFAFRAIPMQDDSRGDLAIKREVESVKQSVLNILKTNRGERPFLPSFGSNLLSYLFENVDSVTKTLIRESIILSLQNFEPRVNVLSVNVNQLSDRNAISVTLEVEIITPVNTVTTIEFTLERLR